VVAKVVIFETQKGDLGKMGARSITETFSLGGVEGWGGEGIGVSIRKEDGRACHENSGGRHYRGWVNSIFKDMYGKTFTGCAVEVEKEDDTWKGKGVLREH